MRPLSWRQLIDIIRFLRDPAAGPVPKWAALLALFYLLWPLDLLPGLPPFSWLDDATVLWLVYQFLSMQLEGYRQGAGGRGGEPGGDRAGRRTPRWGGGAGGPGGRDGDGVIDARGRVR
ncbi:MAG TPA: DUF1232 domain-containing protein [Thermaerobacter sp.]